MDTSNHSSSRIYWLTRPGQRLAAYLDYVSSHPTLSTDIAFADTSVPEQQDLDRHGLPGLNYPFFADEGIDLDTIPDDPEQPLDDDADDYGDHSPEED